MNYILPIILISITQSTKKLNFMNLRNLFLQPRNQEKIDDQQANPNGIIFGDLRYNELGYLTVPIDVDDPMQRFNLFLDIEGGVTEFGGSYMFLPLKGAITQNPEFIENYFDLNESNIIDLEQEAIHYTKLGVCYGKFVYSSLWIYNNYMGYNWILCLEIDLLVSGGDGIISFTREIDNSTNVYTILSKLYYLDKLIPYQVISIKLPTANSPNPQLFIGNYYYDFDDLSKTKAICNLTSIDKKDIVWQIENTSLVYGDYIYPFNLTNRTEFNVKLMFTTSQANMFIPLHYIDVFLKYLPNDCKKETFEGYNDMWVITCSGMEDIQNIYFEFYPYLVLLPKSRFWNKNQNTQLYVLQVIFIEKITKIELGLSIFEHYHILFDHQNSIVLMYPQNDGLVIDLNFVPSSNFWLIFGIVLGVVVVGIIIGGFVVWRWQKKKKAETNTLLKEYEIGSLS